MLRYLEGRDYEGVLFEMRKGEIEGYKKYIQAAYFNYYGIIIIYFYEE